jgi:hypothetical protein
MNLGETFLNRFDFKVRRVGKLIHPAGGETFEVSPETRARSFKRVFGEVAQFRFTSGIISRSRFNLSAISLVAGDQTQAGGLVNPAEDLLRQIAGPSGLDLADDAYHCIGIFSPSGWAEERKAQMEIRGNAIFYLVQKEEGTLWSVYGSEGPLKQLFDPEIAEEKQMRARDALGKHARLILPGDQIAMDAFLEEHRLDAETVIHTIQDSKGIFEIVEHKGRTYIRRCIR